MTRSHAAMRRHSSAAVASAAATPSNHEWNVGDASADDSYAFVEVRRVERHGSAPLNTAAMARLGAHLRTPRQAEPPDPPEPRVRLRELGRAPRLSASHGEPPAPRA